MGQVPVSQSKNFSQNNERLEAELNKKDNKIGELQSVITTLQQRLSEAVSAGSQNKGDPESKFQQLYESEKARSN